MRLISQDQLTVSPTTPTPPSEIPLGEPTLQTLPPEDIVPESQPPTPPTPPPTITPEPPTEVVTKTVPIPPGTRVADQSISSITPTRVALSEGAGDDVYGTPEEEQEPVWNIRSLKLRRALRI